MRPGDDMSKLSAYILKEFISFLGYAVLAFLGIFILVDLVENLDSFIEEKLRFWIIVLRFVFMVPYTVVLTFPIAMLLSTMFALGRLGGDNEITAMKASGISLFRIFRPLFVFAFICGFLVMGITELIVPQANSYVKEIKEKGNSFKFNFDISRESSRNNIYLANGDGRIVFAKGYSAENRMARDVFILETRENTLPGSSETSLKTRIDAPYMIFSDSVWALHNGIYRYFQTDREIVTQFDYLEVPFINLKPSDFAKVELEPTEMNYLQLRDYIKNVEERGGDASDWLVDLYLKVSYPFIAFVVVFFGAPLAAGSVRRNKAASFGIALMIAFIFYTVINACQVLGRNGTMNPFAAAWLPIIFFMLIGSFFHLRAKK
jgi:lipopolysaccharide export system permease protein